MDAPATEITALLKSWSGGDPSALARLAEQVYPELRLTARRYMKNERSRQYRELYHAVCEATAAEREALLGRADPELRREVDSLLSALQAGEMLEWPAIQSAPELLENGAATQLADGTCLGPYRIEDLLAEAEWATSSALWTRGWAALSRLRFHINSSAPVLSARRARLPR